MIIQGNRIKKNSTITTQVCIVGAGPAGITLAWYLLKAGIKVLLLEGSRDFGPYTGNSLLSTIDKTFLYNGEVGGLLTNNEPDFLTNPTPDGMNRGWERERYLGGTSTHWGGQCRPLDPISFEARANFPAWPINRTQLDPFYKEAFQFCNLYGSQEDPDNWEQYFDANFWASKEYLDASVPEFQNTEVQMYQFMGPQVRNFDQNEYGGRDLRNSDIPIIINATALELDKQNGSVKSLSVGVMDQLMNYKPPQVTNNFNIKADVFVYACGGLANARQLLLNEIGEEYGQVGLNFITQSVTNDFLNITGNFLDPLELDLLSGKTRKGVSWSDDPRNAKYKVGLQGRIVPSQEFARTYGTSRVWFRVRSSSLYFEQVPNLSSTLSLSDTLDPVFKRRQSKVVWNFKEQDKINFEILMGLFEDIVKSRGAELSYKDWAFLTSNAVVNGHHLGTTRMSVLPEDGVVDKNLKVHNYDNLFVAGSSVFPSGGLANPTFTIVALSIRLASFLSIKLRGQVILEGDED